MLRERLSRGLLVVLALAATAAIYLLVVREDSGGTGREGDGGGEDVPEEVRSLVASMSPEQKVDAIRMVGFEGVDASAPILDVLRLAAARAGDVRASRSIRRWAACSS
jgi:hypothetical protein